MGNFKDNPKKPFVVRIPNKIRKRIIMHEKEDIGFLGALERMLMPVLVATTLKKRGSLWSRFTRGLKNIFHSQPHRRSR